MTKLDLNKELEEVKKINDPQEFADWTKRKVLEVHGNAKKYPKTAFAVGLVLGFLAGAIIL
jgi:hypothetical protein